MRGYNIWRPLMLIAVALLTKSLVNNLCLMFGMSPKSADDLAFVAMIIAALVTYTRMNKQRRK